MHKQTVSVTNKDKFKSLLSDILLELNLFVI